MSRTDGCEVPTVGGEDRGDRTPLRDSDHAGVGPAEGEVVALLDELGHPLEILIDEVTDDELAARERAEKRRLCSRTEAVPGDHVADIGDDGRRHDQRPRQGLQQTRALVVPDVGVVEARDQRSGVDQDLSQPVVPCRRGCRPWRAR